MASLNMTPTTNPEIPRHAGPLTRNDFQFFESITLRYSDNDANGHINNATYYSFFDTSVDSYLLATRYRSILSGPYQTLVVASACRYFRQVSSPGTIQVGVRVAHLGNSTITYQVAVFAGEHEQEASAQGTFTHCCVDRTTQRPVPLPDALRTALNMKLS